MYVTSSGHAFERVQFLHSDGTRDRHPPDPIIGGGAGVEVRILLRFKVTHVEGSASFGRCRSFQWSGISGGRECCEVRGMIQVQVTPVGRVHAMHASNSVLHRYDFHQFADAIGSID